MSGRRVNGIGLAITAVGIVLSGQVSCKVSLCVGSSPHNVPGQRFTLFFTLLGLAVTSLTCPGARPTRIGGKVGGARVFRGTRLPVATVIENPEDPGVDEVIEQFDVTREQIEAGSTS